ncbi:MAG: hypothetical protein P8I94_08480, partial [Emcibacteraceae bacterium]|nr:hypothetical protein [Emcibacteraceae bacterium]
MSENVKNNNKELLDEEINVDLHNSLDELNKKSVHLNPEVDDNEQDQHTRSNIHLKSSELENSDNNTENHKDETVQNKSIT